jgi:hypothetical protein
VANLSVHPCGKPKGGIYVTANLARTRQSPHRLALSTPATLFIFPIPHPKAVSYTCMLFIIPSLSFCYQVPCTISAQSYVIPVLELPAQLAYPVICQPRYSILFCTRVLLDNVIRAKASAVLFESSLSVLDTPILLRFYNIVIVIPHLRCMHGRAC